MGGRPYAELSERGTRYPTRLSAHFLLPCEPDQVSRAEMMGKAGAVRRENKKLGAADSGESGNGGDSRGFASPSGLVPQI